MKIEDDPWMMFSMYLVGALIVMTIALIQNVQYKEYWKESYCLEVDLDKPLDFCLEYEWGQTVIENDV